MIGGDYLLRNPLFGWPTSLSGVKEPKQPQFFFESHPESSITTVIGLVITKSHEKPSLSLSGSRTSKRRVRKICKIGLLKLRARPNTAS